jgi:hypothetical protein
LFTLDVLLAEGQRGGRGWRDQHARWSYVSE